MNTDITNARISEFAVDTMFIDRWSPRSFSPEPVDHEELMALFEAARWAPSAMNEQPWRFIYATKETDRQKFVSALVGFNQVWACAAPVVLFLLATKTFAADKSPNKWAAFDCGAAWVSLAFQAGKLGLHAHAMGGFDSAKAYEVTGVSPDEYDIVAAIVVGKRADPSLLPNALQSREMPNMRKSVQEIAWEI